MAPIVTCTKISKCDLQFAVGYSLRVGTMQYTETSLRTQIDKDPELFQLHYWSLFNLIIQIYKSVPSITLSPKLRRVLRWLLSPRILSASRTGSSFPLWEFCCWNIFRLLKRRNGIVKIRSKTFSPTRLGNGRKPFSGRKAQRWIMDMERRTCRGHWLKRRKSSGTNTALRNLRFPGIRKWTGTKKIYKTSPSETLSS